MVWLKRSLLTVSFFLFTLLYLAHSVFAQDTANFEHIQRFDSNIEILKDGDLLIGETINYYTPFQKHGIFRFIPVRYRQGLFLTEKPITVVSVKDETGFPYQYETYLENKNLVIKIGDPNTTFSGEKTYIISYRVDGAVEWTEEIGAELYWDITGEGWQFPILSSSALVTSEAGFEKSSCYSGQFGTDNQLCTIDYFEEEDWLGSAVGFEYDQPLYFGENVTLALDLEDSYFTKPDTIQTFSTWLQHNWQLLTILLPPLVTGFVWYTRGRDFVFLTEPLSLKDDISAKPKRRKGIFESRRVPFVYEPLDGLTPGQAGLLIDEKTTNREVVAEILDLARKKYLTIEAVYKNERAKKQGKAKDYTFTTTKEEYAELPKHQQLLMEGLFKSATTVKTNTNGKKTFQATTKLSDLKGEFYTTFQKVITELHTSVAEQTWFTSSPQSARLLGYTVTFVLESLTQAAVVFYLAAGGHPIWLIPALAQAPLSFMFASHWPSKTALGSFLMMRSKGLKKSITYGKWREQLKEKAVFIDEVLPFAVATGVVSKLTKDMNELGIPEPDYAKSFAVNSAARSFERNLTEFTSSSSSGLSYNPSKSSSYSGSSGFSGGSSGGGGGGGGGGSW